jgi:nitrate/nitrite transporter NarK
MTVHRSRVVTFLACALAAALTVPAALLPHGWALLGLLLLIGGGARGVFPVYHALTQELSADHQGKVTGFAGVAGWAVSAPAQTLFGRRIDQTGSFNLGLAIAGCLPLLGFAVIWLFWGRTAPQEERTT